MSEECVTIKVVRSNVIYIYVFDCFSFNEKIIEVSLKDNENMVIPRMFWSVIFTEFIFMTKYNPY